MGSWVILVFSSNSLYWKDRPQPWAKQQYLIILKIAFLGYNINHMIID